MTFQGSQAIRDRRAPVPDQGDKNGEETTVVGADQFRCNIRRMRDATGRAAFHGAAGYCKYTVKITGPTNTNPLDPWVVND